MIKRSTVEENGLAWNGNSFLRKEFDDDMVFPSNWSRLVAACLIFGLAGCGGSGVKTASVRGKVTVGNSAPFKKGIVRFFPKPDSNVSGREAVTDDNGNYVMMFSGNQAGLQPGDYLVSFSLYQMPDGSPVPDQTGEANPKTPSQLGAVEFVPPEYSNVMSDKNPVTVPPGGGTFNFDIPELKAQSSGKPGGRK
jgi:hypothetical protein